MKYLPGKLLTIGLAVAAVASIVVIPTATSGAAETAGGLPVLPNVPCAMNTPKDVNIAYPGGNRVLRGVNNYTLQLTKGSPLGEPQASYDFLASKLSTQGPGIIRLAVPWENLQPVRADGNLRKSLDSSFDVNYICKVLVPEVNKIERAGLRVILDLHNGCTYPWGPGSNGGQPYIMCGQAGGITKQHVWRIWTLLSRTFRADSGVIGYDLMNEPRYNIGSTPSRKLDVENTMRIWKSYSQHMVSAVRASGDTHMLWVEPVLGSKFRLPTAAPDGPWIKDPLNKTMYSEHFYASANTDPERKVIMQKDFDERLHTIREFGDWCEKWGTRCSIGEIGFNADFNQSGRIATEAQYRGFAESAYQLADEYKMDVTYFASTRKMCTGYIAYCSTHPSGPAVGINKSNWQASVIEKYPTVRY